MDIEEMHIHFREIGQLMGMQTTRAIFPEDIDLCLNNAIINKVREILAVHIGKSGYSDKIARQGAGVSPINALRTLYSFEEIKGELLDGEGTELNPYSYTIYDERVLLYTGFQLNYDKYLYNCRIVESEKLSDTLHDFCNRATKQFPIIAVYGDEYSINCNFYTGENNTIKPNTFRYLYIRVPAKVHYDEEIVENRVDCDLPYYLHSEIVTDAVRLYLSSIGAISNDNKRNITT